jgi:hypothetical protein
MLEFYNVGLYPYKQYSVIQGGDGGAGIRYVYWITENAAWKSCRRYCSIMSLLTLVQSHTSHQRG